jgi:hypothetical protein
MDPHVTVLAQRLEATRHDAVLGVTSHLDSRHPGSDQDRIRLGDLLARGRERAVAAWDRPRARPLLERLERAVSAIDLRDGGHGIFVVATPDLSTACLVPFPLADEVVIGVAATMRVLAGVAGDASVVERDPTEHVSGMRS